MKVLVTGANGFVGRALVAAIEAKGAQVIRAVRQPGGERNEVIVGDIDAETDWHRALHGCDIVFHLAGRAHRTHETAQDPFTEYKKTNVIATENLARQAVAFGAKRLVYMSSVKVNGEVTAMKQAYTETDIPAPRDPYGRSKLMAEQLLERMAGETPLEVVVVRPPLVYGPEVKGNLLQMLHLLNKRVPLPLASVHNRRSLIYVGNLVDAMILCARHPHAANQTWLVSDGEDLSVPGLLSSLGAGIGHPARLFPCPVWGLDLGARVTGRVAQLRKITGSLRIDSSKIRSELGWVPPFTVHEGLKETTEWYRRLH
jgi:nucleoside-diphosphate-sugar epimerase